MSASLVQFPLASKQDVVEMLRAIAKDIENGDFGDAEKLEMVCAIRNSDDHSRMIWGANADRDKVYRLLGLAQHWMNEEES